MNRALEVRGVLGLRVLREAGSATVAQLAEDYAVSRATIYRTIKRAKTKEKGAL